MATDDPGGRLHRREAVRLVFRCHGCAVCFPDDAGGPGCCPRCGSIGGHERLGRPAASEPAAPARRRRDP